MSTPTTTPMMENGSYMLFGPKEAMGVVLGKSGAGVLCFKVPGYGDKIGGLIALMVLPEDVTGNGCEMSLWRKRTSGTPVQDCILTKNTASAAGVKKSHFVITVCSAREPQVSPGPVTPVLAYNYKCC